MSLIPLVPGTAGIYQTAFAALHAGISVVPIRADGTKQPMVSWRQYQRHRATTRELEYWFRTPEPGIAFLTGRVSGNLEALDFDDFRTFEAWRQRIQEQRELAALYHTVSWGYLEATPAGGRHVLYRDHPHIW